MLIKSESIAKLQKKYNDNKSPALKRTLETEHMLFGRMVEQNLKPVIQRYSDALVRMTSANQSVVKNYKAQLALQSDVDFLSDIWFKEYSLASNINKKMMFDKFSRGILSRWKIIKSVKSFNTLLELNALLELNNALTSPVAKEITDALKNGITEK